MSKFIEIKSRKRLPGAEGMGTRKLMFNGNGVYTEIYTEIIKSFEHRAW